jgi:hypothetical protein
VCANAEATTFWLNPAQQAVLADEASSPFFSGGMSAAHDRQSVMLPSLPDYAAFEPFLGRMSNGRNPRWSQKSAIL